MKLLIVSHYFWPENLQINDVARSIKSKGNEVHVLTGKPNYPDGSFYQGYQFFKKGDEVWQGIKIFRSKVFPRGKKSKVRLSINYLSSALFGSIKAYFHKENYDAILVYGVSPVTTAIPAIVIGKKKNIPVYFWVQDLWPQTVADAGNIHNKSVLGALNILTKWVYKHSKKVLIQSKGFRSYIIKQGVLDNKIIYHPNTVDSFYHEVSPSKEIKKILPQAPFIIMFAGNIGEAQDFENVMEVANKIHAKNNNIHFVVLGDGSKKPYVVEKIDQYGLKDNFHLLGAFPAKQMPHFFACADVMLLTLKKSEVFALVIPNKMQAYLACAKPIIVGADGIVADMVKEAQSGFASPSGDCQGMVNNILAIYNLSDADRRLMGKNGRKYFEENFDRDKLLNRLLDLVKQS